MLILLRNYAIIKIDVSYINDNWSLVSLGLNDYGLKVLKIVCTIY